MIRNDLLRTADPGQPGQRKHALKAVRATCPSADLWRLWILTVAQRGSTLSAIIVMIPPAAPSAPVRATLSASASLNGHAHALATADDSTGITTSLASADSTVPDGHTGRPRCRVMPALAGAAKREGLLEPVATPTLAGILLGALPR